MYYYDGFIFLSLFFVGLGAGVVKELSLDEELEAVECSVERVHEKLYNSADLGSSALSLTHQRNVDFRTHHLYDILRLIH